MKFINEAINKDFTENGYCKLPLLNEVDINQLREFAEEHLLTHEITNTDYGMYVSLEEDAELKNRAKEFVRDIVAPKLSNHLDDYQIHLGGYLIKAPDHSKYTFPHQDWVFADNETEDVSATCWISLFDLEEENGTLGFLKGSSTFLNYTVGSPSPVVPTPTMGKEGDIFPYLKFEPVKAGEALIFNNKTIHAAQANSGSFYRVAIGIGITPKNTALFHYFLNPENPEEFLKLRVQEEFFMTYNNDDLYELFLNKQIPELCEVVGKVPVNKHSYPAVDEILENAITFGNVKTDNSLDFNKHFQKPNEPEPDITEEKIIEETSVDTRTFFQKYTPINIYREAKYRLGNLMAK